MPTTPSQLYLVQSAIANADWTLTVTNAATTPIQEWKASACALHLGHQAYSDAQLWIKEDDPRGGFFLRSPFVEGGACLRAGGPQGNGTAKMAAKSLSDAELIWRKENGNDAWGCLNKLADWEQKLQARGDGPYDEKTALISWEYSHGRENEHWKLVPYTPDFARAEITYGDPTVVLADPISATSQHVQNTSAAPIEFTATLKTSKTSTHTHSVTSASSTTLTNTKTIGAKFTIDKVFEISAQGQVSRATTTGITIGDQDTVSEAIEVSTSVKVAVPAQKSYEVLLMARNATVTAPYKATFARRKPDGSVGATYTIEGTYTYTATYAYFVKVNDLVAGTSTAVPDAVTSVPHITMKAL